MRVALVVVTFNRSTVLAATLRAVERQTRAPDAIIIVDNDSHDDTLAMLGRDFPAVQALKAGGNVGVNAGLALGMKEAMRQDFDVCWLMDDDSKTPPDSLEELLAALETCPDLVGIGYQGGCIRLGSIRHLKTPEQVRRQRHLGGGVYAVDFFIVDGGLITRRAIEAVGYPPEDYFMMIGDIEYPYRMTRAGLQLGVFERDRIDRGLLGAQGDGSGKPPWRAYYKARNQVRMAITYRSPLLLIAALARIARLATKDTLKGHGARARALLKGTWDGLLGRMGRTVEPSGP